VRALAEELGGGRVSESLKRLAERLQRGDSWQAALSDPQIRLPDHVRGLLEASVRTPHVAATLEQFVHLNRRSAQLAREMWLSVAYPLAVIVCVTVLFACFEFFIVAEMARIYDDIYTDFALSSSPLGLPAMTRLLVAWSGPPAIGLLLLVLIVGVLLPVIWSVWRPLGLDVLAHRLPILGPLWLWGGMVDLCRLLALLLEAGIPLPDALRMTAAGLKSSELAQACRRMARHVEAGESLAEAAAITPPLPDTLGPVVHWGESRSALPDALQAAAEMYEGRVRMQLAFVRLFLPPCVFIFAGGVILLSLFAIFVPMIRIITVLS
jgi:type II secretory pathway component PulF